MTVKESVPDYPVFEGGSALEQNLNRRYAEAAGNHVNGWFYTCFYAEKTLAFEEDGGWEKGGASYFKVTHPEVHSKAELRALTERFFSKAQTGLFFDRDPKRWKDRDGSLYWATVGGVGDHLVSKIGLVLQKQSARAYHIVFLVFGESAPAPSAWEAELLWEDGRWVFDTEIPLPDADTLFTVLTPEEALAQLQKNGSAYANADLYPKPGRLLRYDPDLWLCGEDVLYVQAGLIEMNYSGLAMTGVYDQQTADAMSRFQKNHSLSVTGTVDRADADALDEALRLWRNKTALLYKLEGSWAMADFAEYRFYSSGSYEIYSVDAFEGTMYLSESGSIEVLSADTARLCPKSGSQKTIVLSSDGTYITIGGESEYVLVRR